MPWPISATRQAVDTSSTTPIAVAARCPSPSAHGPVDAVADVDPGSESPEAEQRRLRRAFQLMAGVTAARA